jgi:uncharacterized pyridoxamine 5'-phosphate oxidase family protein
MNLDEVFKFLDSEKLGVLATIGEDGAPEAALMGVAATAELELMFDTVKSSRKYRNLKNNPQVAFVIGCSTEVTVQYEGIAEELAGESLAKYKKIYFAKFTDGPFREVGRGSRILWCGRSGLGIAITILRPGGSKSKSFRELQERKS